MNPRRRFPAVWLPVVWLPAVCALLAGCAGFGSHAGLSTDIGPGQQATIEADGTEYTVIVYSRGGDVRLRADGPPPAEITIGVRGSASLDGEGRHTFRVVNVGTTKARADLTVRGASYASLVGPIVGN